jgi:hypothetical protein
MYMTIEEQLQAVFADTKPIECPTTIKLYHAHRPGHGCRRVIARTDAEAALKAAARYPSAYMSRASTCPHCTGEIHWRIKEEQA